MADGDPLEVLRNQFAKGEITEEEFESKKEVLEGSRSDKEEGSVDTQDNEEASASISGSQVTKVSIAVIIFAIVFSLWTTGPQISAQKASASAPSQNTEQASVHNYPVGDSKQEGNYVAIDSLFQVAAGDSSFNVTEVSVKLGNTIELGSGFDDGIMISRYTIELRKGDLPTFQERRDSPLRIKRNTDSVYTSRYLLENSIDFMSKGDKAMFAVDPDSDLEQVPYGCYNATVTVRELDGPPTQRRINDLREHFLAGIQTHEVCIDKDGVESSAFEIANYPERLALSIGDLPVGYRKHEGNQTSRFYSVSYVKENQSVTNGVYITNSTVSAKELANNLTGLKSNDWSYKKVDSRFDHTVYIAGSIQETDSSVLRSTNVNLVAILQRENLVSYIYFRNLEERTNTETTENLIAEAARELGVSYDSSDLQNKLDAYYME